MGLAGYQKAKAKSKPTYKLNLRENLPIIWLLGCILLVIGGLYDGKNATQRKNQRGKTYIYEDILLKKGKTYPQKAKSTYGKPLKIKGK